MEDIYLKIAHAHHAALDDAVKVLNERNKIAGFEGMGFAVTYPALDAALSKLHAAIVEIEHLQEERERQVDSP